MILVIADDFSGAAELAGVGWRLGLRAEVHLEFDPDSRADLIAVDTESRSLAPEDAAKKVREISKQILEAGPTWIYKKTDSVFRGNLAAEIAAILDVTNHERSLLIPANPSKNRIIENGCYFIDGVPLDETGFAADPEFPARSDRVRELLGREADPRIKVPETVSSDNLESLAADAGSSTLPAGGADFFEALLRQRSAGPVEEGEVADATGFDQSGGRLFVCGSLAAWPEREAQFKTAGNPIFQFPRPEEEAGWRLAIAETLAEGRTVLAAIGDPPSRNGEPSELVGDFGQVISGLLAEFGGDIPTVFLEGGATAIAVLGEMETRQFRVIGEAGPGAPFLETIGVRGPVLCPKPGSYPWPDSVGTTWADRVPMKDPGKLHSI